jgi:2-dehydro-3-deoxygluconokinase
MELRKDARYDLVTLTSMGVRITPVERQPVHGSSLYEMQATSAESNVLNVSASLGLRTKALTKFVKGSPISQFNKGELRKRGIEFEGMEIEQGGPWGYRHQFNIADSGYGMRGPRVHNDRAGEVGRTLSPGDFDLERIFGEEGCRILHLSGLIAAMSPETGRACLAVAAAAKKHGAWYPSTSITAPHSGRAGKRSCAGYSASRLGRRHADRKRGDFQLALGIEGLPQAAAGSPAR